MDLKSVLSSKSKTTQTDKQTNERKFRLFPSNSTNFTVWFRNHSRICRLFIETGF